MNIKKLLEIEDTMRIGTTSSSPFTGSPTFDKVPFHIDVGRKPMLNVYVLIERDDPNVLHYGRIMEGTEENSRAEPLRLQQYQAYQIGQRDPRPGDEAPHVARIMQIEILGEIRGDEKKAQKLADLAIEEPGTLAQTGKGVYELPSKHIPWLLGTPTSLQDGFAIGIAESGNASVPFILPMEAAARHIAVAGKTGVGKSYFGGVLVEEFHRQGIPVVVFDVLGDMIRATDDLGGHTLWAGTDLRIPYSVLGTTEFMNFIPNLTRDQSELVALAYDEVFGEALDTLETNGDVSIPLQHLLDRIRDIAASFGQEPVGDRAARRVQAAISRNTLLTAETESWLHQIAEKPVTNIFVGHLGQNARNLVVGATARILQIMRRRSRIPPLIAMIDESHLFLPAGHEITPSTHVVRELVRTARHDAIGIVLVTQSPSSMDKQVFLTCNTRIVFALDKEDLNLVAGTMGDLPQETIDRIPKQAKGIAIVSSGMDIMRHPARVRIRKRTTREGAPTPNLAEEVKKWRKQKNG